MSDDPKQGEHEDDPGTDDWPAGQGADTDDTQKLPCSQAAHDPSEAVYVPELHGDWHDPSLI